MGGLFYKKEGGGYYLFSLFLYQLTLSSVVFLWVFGVCVCVCVCVSACFMYLHQYHWKNLVL